MDKDSLYSIIGARIRKARESAGVSQAKLALQLKMSRTSIVNIEAGRQHPPVHILWQIAELIGTEAPLLIPKQSEYRAHTQPISLDTKTIAEIEKVASGDPATKKDLTAFISRVRSRSTAQ